MEDPKSHEHRNKGFCASVMNCAIKYALGNPFRNSFYNCFTSLNITKVIYDLIISFKIKVQV